MRIDHIAYRVRDRQAAANFFIKAFGYRIEDDFQIDFDDGSTAKCFALSPPEVSEDFGDLAESMRSICIYNNTVYQIPPDIFVSEGSDGSIVKKWVEERGNGGVHHIAYQVDDVLDLMKSWKKKDLATFTTEEPIVAEGLSQCFTHPHPITGVIYEFIYRTGKGFNVDNVKNLMESTKDES